MKITRAFLISSSRLGQTALRSMRGLGSWATIQVGVELDVSQLLLCISSRQPKVSVWCVVGMSLVVFVHGCNTLSCCEKERREEKEKERERYKIQDRLALDQKNRHARMVESFEGSSRHREQRNATPTQRKRSP